MSRLAFLHRLLLWLYFPLLAMYCLVLGSLVVLALVYLPGVVCGVFVMVPVVAFAGLGLGHILITLARGLAGQSRSDDGEMRLPRKMVGELYELVRNVACRHGLLPPDDIRLAADTIAHVYEDSKGERILVLGAVALATFSQDAIAGIIAHELAHFTAGDTTLTRRRRPAILCMAILDYEFARHPISRLNPGVWFLSGYHLLYNVVAAAHSREREYAADRFEVMHAGKEIAAASLIRLTVTQRLPWARLSTVIEQCAATGLAPGQLFAEQVQRARATSPSDWQDALKKELKRPTEVFDSHPALKARLEAMGVSSRKALRLTLEDSGPPAHELIPAWPSIEKLLAEHLVEPYRELYLLKRDMAQIVLGRQLGGV
jgi:Zn-dependent protease with chaperone function